MVDKLTIRNMGLAWYKPTVSDTIEYAMTII